MLFVVACSFDNVRPAENVERSGELVSDRMQWQASPRNRSLCFNVDLLLLARELQRLHVTIRKALSDDACLALGKIKVSEGAPLSPSRADVTDTVIRPVA